MDAELTAVPRDRLQMAVFEAIGRASRLRRPNGTYDDELETEIAEALVHTVRAEVYAQMIVSLERFDQHTIRNYFQLCRMLRFMERRERKRAFRVARRVI